MSSTSKGCFRTTTETQTRWGARWAAVLVVLLVDASTSAAQNPLAENGTESESLAETPISDVADQPEYRVAEISDYARIFAERAEKETPAESPRNPQLLEETSESRALAELRTNYGSEFQQWEYLIDELSASSFSARERANGRLHQAGHKIVPLLRSRLSIDKDSEAQIRLRQLLLTLEKQYFQAIKADFLAGDDSAIDGWTVAKQLMGDSLSSRRAYIDVFQESPELAKSLEGTTADREAAVAQFLNSPFVDINRSGLTAVLLATADPMLRPSLQIQSQVASWFRMGPSSELRRMPDSMVYGERLMGAFLLKTSADDRYDWLYYGLNLDLPATAVLAKRTLIESVDPDTLAFAMAALVRYPDAKCVDIMAALFDDDRLLNQDGGINLRNGKRTETRVSDVAMAAAGAVLGQSTKEIGFPLNANHPRVGLDIRQIEIPAGDPKIADAMRKQIRENVEALIKTRTESK